MKKAYDYIFIGGGIIGMSAALQMQQKFPEAKILLLEKEASPAHHQTGHNSGVIHAGVYYQPGSLRAKLCKQGNVQTIEFCERYELPYLQCGKLLVATNELEYARMRALAERCEQNGIIYTLLDEAELREHEPNIAGFGALRVADTGITNYSAITHKMAELFERAGGEIRYNERVSNIQDADGHVTIKTQKDQYIGGYLIACPGLHADILVRMLGIKPDFKIVPFRGEYFRLPKKMNSVVNHLIYPIPDPKLPFLGVHLTRMIDGSVTVGPNAVLALSREGYRWSDIDLKHLASIAVFPGIRRFIKKNPKTSFQEIRNSFWRKGYLEQVQKYCPSVKLEDLQPYPAGVRAQAMRADGSLIEDFLFQQSEHALVVCNAPSPAATSAMPIAQMIIERVIAATGNQPAAPETCPTTPDAVSEDTNPQ